MIKEIKIRNTQNGPVVIIKNEFSLAGPYSIFRCNEYLRSLGTSQKIKFESFTQYNDLLKAIAEELNVSYSIEVQ